MIEQELEQAQAIYQMITEFFVNYSFQLIGALIILLIGMFVAKKISIVVERLCVNKGLDITLSRFIANTAKILIVVMVAIIALGKLGISVTPFVAAIGAMSLGAGLAVQGLLSNYGAGLNIIFARPFVIGDTIRIDDVAGQVKEVHLAHTLLVDEDGVEITIPNKHIVGEIIHNSHNDSLVETSIGIAYDSDTDAAIRAIREALATVEALKDTRPALIGVDSFDDSAVAISVRFWAPTARYYETRYEANGAIFKALLAAGIEIPFPQRVIRTLEEPSDRPSS